MELSGCKALALALLVVSSRFLHGLGCCTEPGSPGATREEAKQLGTGEAAEALRLRSRSAQAQETAQHGGAQGAAPRPRGASGASAFPAVIPPSNARGFGPRKREDGRTFAPAAFESAGRLGLARKLLQGVDTDGSSKDSKPSCKSYHTGCPPPP